MVAPFVAKTTATPTPRATGAEEPPSSSRQSPWLWVALGVVLLGAALVALLVVLVRRNRASGPLRPLRSFDLRRLNLLN
ncbi:MAG: hypothetical protein ABI251_12360 [Mycobacteriaceae bacterium]